MGAYKKYMPIHGINPMKRVYEERYLLEKAYDFLSVKIKGTTLWATGACQPSDHSIRYEYKLRYTPGESPKVFTIDPQIAYHDDIHMYSRDNSLCLYYPRDYSFTSSSHLYNTIIPWAHEWFLYYELYLLKGKWLHPFVSHQKI
jgi:hypothetical protein